MKLKQLLRREVFLRIWLRKEILFALLSGRMRHGCPKDGHAEIQNFTFLAIA